MKKSKLWFFLLLLSLAGSVVSYAAEQTDIYAPVMDSGVTQPETPLPGEETEEPEESAEPTQEPVPEEPEAEPLDYSEFLSDIRCICLGILFVVSFGTGALVALSVQKGLHQC